MGHNSPETVARLAARAPLIGQGRPLTDAEKAKAQLEAENNIACQALQQEQKEVDAIVRLLLSSPDFDLGAALDAPEEFTKKARGLAKHLVSESNKSDYAEIIAEMKRVGAPVERQLRLICERHGVEVPAEKSAEPAKLVAG